MLDEQDGALGHPALDEPAEIGHVAGTDAACGLIEQEDLRIADERSGEGHALLDRVRQFAGQPAGV
ncbi:unannotated protein [freshwater metagenome]|uniref:Unannotated protein n=1 Tax=freshwater metagenome TaxID=449393 RepID=A0A6J6UH12_9ZZZZ